MQFSKRNHWNSLFFKTFLYILMWWLQIYETWSTFGSYFKIACYSARSTREKLFRYKSIHIKMPTFPEILLYLSFQFSNWECFRFCQTANAKWKIFCYYTLFAYFKSFVQYEKSWKQVCFWQKFRIFKYSTQKSKLNLNFLIVGQTAEIQIGLKHFCFQTFVVQNGGRTFYQVIKLLSLQTFSSI